MKNPRQWIELRKFIHIFYQSWSKIHLKRYKPIYKSLDLVHDSSRQIVKNTHKSWIRLKQSCKRIIGMFVLVVVIKKLVKKARKSWVTYSIIRLVLFALFFGFRKNEDKSELRKKKMKEDLKIC